MQNRCSRRILPIDFNNPEVTYENGILTLRGETAERVERLAQAAGMTPEAFLKMAFHKAKNDPEFMQRVAQKARRFSL